MELIKIAPRRHTVFEVGSHRRRDKIVGDVHGDLAEIFAHAFQHKAHHAGIEVDVGRMVKEVEGACAVKLQRRGDPLGLRLRLAQQLLIQILEQRRFGLVQPQRQFPVHLTHTAVNDGFLNGLQTVPASHHQLTQRQQKIRFQGQRAIPAAHVHLNIHRGNVVGTVRRDLDDLAAQPLHQRGIFAHRVYHDDAILRNGKKDVQQFTLGGKALAAARGAKVQAVGGFQLFAVSHDDVMGQGVHAVVEGRAIHAKLPRHKGDEDGGGAGSHAPLNFNAVVAESQRGHIALLLLPVQPLDGTVIFLRDAVHGENVVFQPLPRGGGVDDQERQEEHSLVAALQVGQQLGGILGKGDEIGRENVRVISGAGSLALLLHFHLVDVGDFTLDRFNGLDLIHRLNVHGDGQLGVQLQNLRQQLIRKFRRHDLQIGRRAPCLAHAERAALPEVKAVRHDKVFRSHARMGDVRPLEAERLPAAGVKLAVQQGKTLPPVEGLALYPQPLKVADHVRLYTLQTGPGGGHIFSGDAKGDVLGPFDTVVAFGNLVFQHPRVFRADAVEAVIRLGDIHLVAAPGAAAAVDKGKLERQRTVKIIQPRTPAAENGRLILGGRNGIVDVLIFQRFCVDTAGELTNAVWQHPHIGNGLLGRYGRRTITGPRQAF